MLPIPLVHTLGCSPPQGSDGHIALVSQTKSGISEMRSAEEWERIEEVFFSALERSGDERQQFVEEACGNDPDLLERVRRLLEAHDRGDDFLNISSHESLRKTFEEAITAPLSMLAAGTMMGKYRIREFLSGGGMGQVYLATESGLRRKVAIKILPPELHQQADRVRRLKLEALAISTLNHPNIITIYEIGEGEGFPYIAMEFVEGQTLRQFCNRGSASIDDVLDIATQTTSALVAAHHAGVVHRDIKPENIMIRPDGIVKVLDFGLAKLKKPRLENDSRATVAGGFESVSHFGVPIGTPNYMSPEQARGEATDARTDLFSLGVVIYELLSGSNPFKGASPAEGMAAILQTDPRPLSHVDPRVSNALEATVMRALQKQRHKRYQSAADMLNDLKLIRSRMNTSTKGGLRWWPWSGARDSGVLSSVKTQTLGAIRTAQKHPVMVFVFAIALLILLKVFFDQSQSIKWLAVLPVTNATGDSSLDYFTEGLTEGLTSSLSETGQFNVISSTSSRKFKGTDINPRDVAKELGVNALMVGRATRKDGRLTLSLELMTGTDGRQLWWKRYENQSENYSVILGSVVNDVMERLGLNHDKLAGNQGSARPSKSDEALKLYAQGSKILRDNRNSESGLLTSIDYFKQAIEKDSNYAPAYAACAAAYNRLGVRFQRSDEMFPLARDYATKARLIEPNLPDAYAELAAVSYHYDWDWKQAESELKQALAYNPNLVDAHLRYANLLCILGRPREAVNHSLLAVQHDPLSIGALANLGTSYYYEGSFNEGDAQYRKILLDLDSTYADSYNAFAWTFENSGQFDKALEQLRIAATLSPDDPAITAAFARVFAKQQNRVKATEMLEELKRLSRIKYVSRAWFADVYGELGDKDSAFKELESAYNERSAYLPFFISDSMTFKSLRSDGRFIEFLKRMRMPRR